MKVAVNRLGKFSRSKQSRSNVPRTYAPARRFFAHRSAELGRSLASEIFLTNLQTDFFSSLLGAQPLSGLSLQSQGWFSTTRPEAQKMSVLEIIAPKSTL